MDAVLALALLLLLNDGSLFILGTGIGTTLGDVALLCRFKLLLLSEVGSGYLCDGCCFGW